MNEISSKHGFRLSTTFKRIHNRLDASRSGSRSADLDRPRSGNVPAVLGLVALTALTSWVVARISIWLVPVYMSAMVLIFAAPRASRPKVAAPVPEEPATEPGEGVEPTSDVDSQGTSSDPVDAAVAVSPKPRKRRGKGKRSTKAAAAEADPTAAQVTWIRVGPGKFVRADVQDPEAEGSPSPVSVPDAGAVADASGEGVQPDSPIAKDDTTGGAEASEEPGSFDQPESSEVFEDPAEEHGNAPSTLGEGLETAVFPDESEHDDPELDLVATLAPEPIAAAVDDAPGEGVFPDSPTTEDGTKDDEVASEEHGSFVFPESFEASEIGATADEEDLEEYGSSEFSESSEAFEEPAEEHGNAPSTLGAGSESTGLFDEADREAPCPGPVATRAADPTGEPEPVAAPAAPIASISIPSTTAMRDPGPIRPPVLLDPPTAETHRRRTVGPVVCSSRLRNVRRGDEPRPSILNDRAADVRLRQRTSRIRSRLIHVERDFQPRSPPMRA